KKTLRRSANRRRSVAADVSRRTLFPPQNPKGIPASSPGLDRLRFPAVQPWVHGPRAHQPQTGLWPSASSPFGEPSGPPLNPHPFRRGEGRPALRRFGGGGGEGSIFSSWFWSIGRAKKLFLAKFSPRPKIPPQSQRNAWTCRWQPSIARKSKPFSANTASP